MLKYIQIFTALQKNEQLLLTGTHTISLALAQIKGLEKAPSYSEFKNSSSKRFVNHKASGVFVFSVFIFNAPSLKGKRGATSLKNGPFAALILALVHDIQSVSSIGCPQCE